MNLHCFIKNACGQSIQLSYLNRELRRRRRVCVSVAHGGSNLGTSSLPRPSSIMRACVENSGLGTIGYRILISRYTPYTVYSRIANKLMDRAPHIQIHIIDLSELAKRVCSRSRSRRPRRPACTHLATYASTLSPSRYRPRPAGLALALAARVDTH